MDTDNRRTTVTAQSTSARRSALLTSVLVASLALPTLQGFDRAVNTESGDPYSPHDTNVLNTAGGFAASGHPGGPINGKAAPQALASIAAPPDRSDGLGGANQTSHIASVQLLGRADALGSAASATHSVIGSSRFTPVVLPTVVVRSAPSGFDWTAAMIGARVGLGLALVAMAALLALGRRDISLPS